MGFAQNVHCLQGLLIITQTPDSGLGSRDVCRQCSLRPRGLRGLRSMVWAAGFGALDFDLQASMGAFFRVEALLSGRNQDSCLCH